jgi:peptidoglycan/LPS O-acetylase OafA/YrhL
MESQRSNPMERGELDYLTALRFLAAIGVVFHHVGMNLEGFTPFASKIILAIREHGNLGVQFFFTLSGFILAYVYTTRSSIDWTSFVTARVARVVPVYLIALLVGLPMLYGNIADHVANHGLALGWVVSAIKAFAVLFLVQAWLPSVALFWNGVSWTLSAEAFFYACFPAILKWSRDRSTKLLVMILACLMAFELARTFANVMYPTLLWGCMPAMRIHEFVSGVIVCILYLRGFAPGLLMGTFASMVLAMCMLVPHGGAFTEMMRTVGTHAGFCVLISALAISRPSGSKAKNFMKPLIFLGQISYSMYLLHFPLLVLWEKFYGPAYLGLWWFLLLVFVASSATYLWIEEPSRKWIRKKWQSK